MEFNATFFVVLISFLLFTYFMNKILYVPISNIIEKRNGVIKSEYDKAKVADEEAAVLKKQKEDILLTSNNEARRYVAEKVDTANSEAKELLLEAKHNSIKNLEIHRDVIAKKSDEVKDKLDKVIETLSEEIVSKVTK